MSKKLRNEELIDYFDSENDQNKQKMNKLFGFVKLI